MLFRPRPDTKGQGAAGPMDSSIAPLQCTFGVRTLTRMRMRTQLELFNWPNTDHRRHYCRRASPPLMPEWPVRQVMAAVI